MPNGFLSLGMNRRLTKRFIEDDPTTLVLKTVVDQSRPGGAKATVPGTPRDPQVFKIIYPGGDGITVTADGKTRRFDFIIVGEHDATLDIRDFWDEDNQRYVIDYLFPYNGYEVKGGGVTHGNAPDHG